MTKNWLLPTYIGPFVIDHYESDENISLKDMDDTPIGIYQRQLIKKYIQGWWY